MAGYYKMVVGEEIPRPPSGRLLRPDERLSYSVNLNRVLVPYTAKPFYWLAQGRVGNWNPGIFGLLVANSIFTATAAFLLVIVGFRILGDRATALLAATLYLLNFAVANLYLVGFVDSGEACFLIAMVWTLMAERWFLLPLWGLLGALAKETFAPLSVAFAMGWWIAGGARRSRLGLIRLAWVFGMGVVSLVTVTVVMSRVSGDLIWPWEYAAYMQSGPASDVTAFLIAFLRCIFNRTFWYIFAWVLPLGMMRLQHLPRPWLIGTVFAFSAALAMGAYDNALGNTARALLNVAGPILSLSTAMLLSHPRPVVIGSTYPGKQVLVR